MIYEVLHFSEEEKKKKKILIFFVLFLQKWSLLFLQFLYKEVIENWIKFASFEDGLFCDF